MSTHPDDVRTELKFAFFPKCYNAQCGENDRCANYAARDHSDAENSETPDLRMEGGKIICYGYLNDSIGYAVLNDGFFMTIYEYEKSIKK